MYKIITKILKIIKGMMIFCKTCDTILFFYENTPLNPNYALEKKLNFEFKILMCIIRKINTLEFDVSFTNKEITSWGGMVFLKQMLQKIGFRSKCILANDKKIKPFFEKVLHEPALKIIQLADDISIWNYNFFINHGFIIN